jgi:4-alpha-glucanotransferase
MTGNALHNLATDAGIEITWRDVSGHDQTVSDDSLRGVLGAIGLPAATEAQIRDSHAALRQETGGNALPLVTVNVNQPIVLSGNAGPFEITLESGGFITGLAELRGGGVVLPAISEPGYHRLEFNNVVTTIAVAPLRAYTLDDAAAGEKLWGLAVQLYALRRQHDGGIGDFKALEAFIHHAALQGADAVAISPVHAQFSANVFRYGPYAPSNRAALNALHIPEDVNGPVGDNLIDWPASAERKLAVLRKSFKKFKDYAALAAFRAQSGLGMERHAIFEALSAKFSAQDFRTWPVEYRNPADPAVARFALENATEVSYHAWLQYRADAGLQAAQKTAKAAGAKIGLIADLAVGTDHAGSHSWSRQDEVLCDLEIGAPPDLINREGQSWGITAFSPRGLRNSGFAAFIDMLRHALRHAGGVRIDHVMGLARLWVIPQGFPGTQGAYLRMPVDDLMRLVVLESQRHKAVILGEDLGTLPHGFSDKLNAAGIAGLRVMWFERQGHHFSPPSGWTKTAVAMTTTHDLPTVAGWWEGTDITWRERLGMAGDTEENREADRAELWSAFRASGATKAPIPAPAEGAAAADAACVHLGLAASTLALLPIEDALANAEQPNLPGTTDEHPNWRRRLPADAAALFARPDVAARLAALNAARKA